MNNWLNTRLILLALIACWGCQSQTSVPVQLSGQLQLTATSPWGDPVEGASIKIASTVQLSDSEGSASLVWKADQVGEWFEAECPAGYSGRRLSRPLTQAMLESGQSLAYELSCEPNFLPLAIAIESIGCPEVEIFFQGQSLGKTAVSEASTKKNSGQLHELLELPITELRGTGVEAPRFSLKARSVDPQCILEGPRAAQEVTTQGKNDVEFLVELDARAPGVWMSLHGKKRFARRRVQSKKNSTRFRPYRL